MQSPFAGLMFDLDGVLADTEQLKGLAHVKTLESFGYIVYIEAYRDVLGQPFDEVVSHMAHLASFADLDRAAYRTTYQKNYQQLLAEQLKPAPGANDFLDCARRSFTLAVVTSSDQDTMEFILNRLRMSAHVTATVSANDVHAQKPNPEPYLLAASRLRIPNALSVAFEDTEAGVSSARNAGSPVIAIRHQLNAHHDFSNAAIVVEGLLEISQIRAYLLNPT